MYDRSPRPALGSRPADRVRFLTRTSFASSVSELWFADGRPGAATSAPSAGGEGWTSWSPGFQSTIPSWRRQGIDSGRPSALVLLREALPAAGRGARRRQPAGHRALPHRGNGSVTSLPEAPFLGRPGKAVGLFAPDVARLLLGATRSDWELVRWIHAPDVDRYLGDLRALGGGLVLSV